jgi:putative intracellular protease/amidase
MKKVIVFFANGTEEIEALTPVTIFAAQARM